MFANIGNLIKKLLSLFFVGADGLIKAIKEVYVVGADGTIKKVFGSKIIATFFSATINWNCKYVVTSNDDTLTIKTKTGGGGLGTVNIYLALNNPSAIADAKVEFDYSLVGGASNYLIDVLLREYETSSLSPANYYTLFKRAEDGANKSAHVSLTTSKTFGANCYIQFSIAMGNENANFNTLTISNFTINGTQYAFDANASN